MAAASEPLPLHEIEPRGGRVSIADVDHSEERHAAGNLRDVAVPTPATGSQGSKDGYEGSADSASKSTGRSQAEVNARSSARDSVRPEQTEMRPPPVPRFAKRNESDTPRDAGSPAPPRKRARFTPDRTSLREFQAAAARRRVQGSDADPDPLRSESASFSELSARRRGATAPLPSFTITGDAMEESELFRSAVDDLTIENQKLKTHLRSHPSLPLEVQADRLFELQCFRALSQQDRKRLEDTLAAFARSLDAPSTYEPAQPQQTPPAPKAQHTIKSITDAHAAARLASQSITPSNGTSSTAETDPAADDTPPTTASEPVRKQRPRTPIKSTVSDDEISMNAPPSSTVIFYRGGSFCTDLSADAVDKEHPVPSYEVVADLLDSDDEDEPPSFDQLDDGKSIAFVADESSELRHNVLFKSSLAASGMTDAVVADNWTILVGAPSSSVAQLIMHVPEIQSRSHAYLRRSSRGIWLRAGTGSDGEVPMQYDSSGPEIATPSVTSSELRHLSPHISEQPDYLVSLREPSLPWAPTQTTLAALAEANKALLAARSTSPSSGRSSEARDGDLSSTPPDDETPLDLDDLA